MKIYKFKINGSMVESVKSSITGAEILTLVGKLPIEEYRLYQKLNGQVILEEVGPSEIVDLSNAGIELFKTGKYKFKVDNEIIVVEKTKITGADILCEAGKQPTEKYKLFQKFNGNNNLVEVLYDDIIDLSNQGIEKFVTEEVIEKNISITVNNQVKVILEKFLTGEQIQALVNHTPDKYDLYHIDGMKQTLISANEKVKMCDGMVFNSIIKNIIFG